MSSPRKFAEKIALLQQKQAEGDAAFNTILYEVEAAKQKTDRVSSTKRKLDVPTRKYEISNGMNNSDSNNYTNQSVKIESNNGYDRLSLPPDNSSWRRTLSDSSLHQSMMPTVIAHYNAQHNDDQQLNYENNGVKLEPPPYNAYHHNHLQVSNSQYQPHQQQQQQQQQHNFDLNNNNYINDQTNMFYPSTQQQQQQQNLASSTMNTSHTLLGSRYSGGNHNSNVLMLPPNQYPRGGGSLPDLRTGNVYNNNNNNNNQQVSYSTVPSPPTSNSQHCFRSSSPQQNTNGEFLMLEPQQLSSNIGPVKSPSMRRRHSPIGDVKQPSSRRQNSPSPDVSSNQHSGYRVEPQSPQSQSSYSPQNSPHLIPSPGNELGPFSPPQQQQQQQQQSTDNQQPYFTLSNHFDQITLDNNFYTQQPPSPSSQQNRHRSLPTTPGGVNQFQQGDFYPSFLDDIPTTYTHNQTNNMNVKSPTIPNIILTDVDSSKLDLSKDLANDFSNPFDGLIDANDLQLNNDDFLLNAADLSLDPILCDDTYRMER